MVPDGTSDGDPAVAPLPTRVARTVTDHARVVLVALLVLTAVVGVGVAFLEEDSSLEQFESESPAADAGAYVAENFTAVDENTTTVQVVVRGENVLTRESLLESLAFQQAVRANESVNETVADDRAILGVENVLAASVIRGEQAADLEARAADLEARGEALNETAADLEVALDEVANLSREYERLNVSAEAGEVDEENYSVAAANLESRIDGVVANATADLTPEQARQFERAATSVRRVSAEQVRLEVRHEAGEIGDEEYDFRRGELESDLGDAYTDGTAGVLGDAYDELRTERERLEADAADLQAAGLPPLEAQIDALESLDEAAFEAELESVLTDEGPGRDALALVSSSYEPGTTTAEGRLIVLTQETAAGGTEVGAAGEEIVDSQLDLRTLATDHAADADTDEEYLVFGFGVISEEIDRSMIDSLAIVAPFALAFVVVALFVAYRDPLDIALGVAGILAVLCWTLGFMGWAGIAFNQLFVAVPVLLIGLSIDYAIHVFMRHREKREGRSAAEERTGSEASREHRAARSAAEERTGSETTREHRAEDAGDDSVRGSMTVALAGVGVALVWVTATTVIGFLSNLVSPIAPIREFGVVSAFGIVAAFVVFGALVPAAKVELDAALESRGYDRRRRAFGTGDSRVGDALAIGVVAARRAPLVLLFLVALVTAGGVYGATQVDTSFSQEDFLAEDPPAWTDHLGPLAPGEYRASEDLAYVNERFQREDVRAQILIRGDPTDPAVLDRIADAEAASAEAETVYRLPNGEPDVTSPVSVMREVAEADESFNATLTIADTDGDRVPDRNLASVYDDLFEADQAAASDVLQREGESYEATLVVLAMRGNASAADAAADVRELAATIEGGPDDGVTAVATGGPVVQSDVESALFDTAIQSLALSLLAVFAFLTVAYRLTGNGATLGAVTLLPVALAVAWILGTMYLIEMPFNVLTGTITSLTIGLGVAYSIHVSARYTLELERRGNVWEAMRTTMAGTGGALAGSAATTVGGFGVLVLAILPVLRQFGTITALTITYAFLASVVVLPTLLVLWTRWVGPDVSFEY